MEGIRALLGKNKYALFFTAMAIIMEVFIISYLTKAGMLSAMAVFIVVMAILGVFLRAMGLERSTLFLILALPYLYYIVTNYFAGYISGTLFAYFQTFSESAYLSILIALNLFKLRSENKDDSKRFQIFGEIIIALLMFAGNLFTFIIYKYSTKVFMISSITYLKYFLISVVIYYSNINLYTLKKVLNTLSVIIIVNFTLAVLQAVFGGVFMQPFLGLYFAQERNAVVRAIGAFPWPTELGAFCGVYFILYFFTAKYTKSKYLYAISGMCVGCILLAQARLSLIIVVLVLLISSIKKASSFMVYIIGIVMLICVINTFVGLDKVIGDTIDEYSEVEKMPRIYYVLKGVDVFKDNLIFGVGFDRFGTYWVRQMDDDVIFTRYSIKEFRGSNGKDLTPLLTTDSFVAKVLPEMGLFGTGMLVIFFVSLYRKGLISRKRFPEVEMFIYLLLFHNIYLFNSALSMFTYNIGPTMWLAIGFIVRYNYLSNCEEDKLKNASKVVEVRHNENFKC